MRYSQRLNHLYERVAAEMARVIDGSRAQAEHRAGRGEPDRVPIPCGERGVTLRSLVFEGEWPGWGPRYARPGMAADGSGATGSCSDLISRNSSRPYLPSSRPWPDCL